MKGNRFCALAVLLAIFLGGHVTEASAGVTPISTCQTIMSPGSYELTQNLNHDGTTPANGCLEVDNNNVTIDLKGFTIAGSNTDSGIITIGPQDNIVIRNGMIRDFDAGISIGGADNCRVEWVIAFSNDFDGIVLGNNCDANNNIASNNGDEGIVMDANSTIRNNIANDNATDGIEAGSNNNIIYNTANGNGNNGIVVNCPGNLVGNTAQNNGVANLNQVGAGCKRYNNLF